MGKWNPARPNRGRNGTVWRRNREYVLVRDMGMCFWCHHPGAGEADHYPLSIAQLREAGLNPDDPRHLVASHGTSAPCLTCGCKANQQRNGRRFTATTFRPAMTW